MHAGGSAAGSVEVQGLSVTRPLVIMHLNGPAVHVYLFINSLSPGLHHVDACLHCICHTVKSLQSAVGQLHPLTRPGPQLKSAAQRRYCQADQGTGCRSLGPPVPLRSESVASLRKDRPHRWLG